MTWMIESIRDAAVTPADVFRLYTDPSTWSAWGHNATWARADGPLVEGGIVNVRAGYGKVYPCLILRLVTDRAIELEVRPPFMKVIDTYEVEPTAGGSRVRHALQISGPFVGITKFIRLDRVYRGWLDKEVGKMIEMASARSGGHPIEGGPRA